MPRRTGWIETLDAGRRRELELACDAQPRETATSMYLRFGLASVTPLRTFAHWVRRRRLAHRARAAETPGAATTAPSWEEIELLARQQALARLRAGDPKVYELAVMLRAARDADRGELERRAAQRADELHEVRMARLRSEQSAALERTAQTARLTPEQVAEIRMRVLGL